jgi:hypothetical protein
MACEYKLSGWAITQCGDSAPGILRLLATHKQWILSLPAKDDYPTTGAPNTISDDITLDTTTFADAVWVELGISPEKNRLRKNSIGDIGARSHTASIEAYAPGDDPLIEHAIDQMINAELVVLAQMGNGTWQLLGNLVTPAYLGYASDSGAARNDAVGTTLTLEVPIASKFFPRYTGDLPVPSVVAQ